MDEGREVREAEAGPGAEAGAGFRGDGIREGGSATV